MEIMDYVRPELLVVAVVLYFIGVGIKKSGKVDCRYIPLINGAAGIAVCALYVFATSSFAGAKDVAMAVFTAVTQGILVAGLSTYIHQVQKQIKEKK